jgi:hypothetical protein
MKILSFIFSAKTLGGFDISDFKNIPLFENPRHFNKIRVLFRVHNSINAANDFHGALIQFNQRSK